MTTEDQFNEDDNLLESLGHLFAVDTPHQPSPAELAAFRNLFAAHASAVVDPTITMSTVDPTSTIERPDVVDPTMQMNTIDATTLMARPTSVDPTMQINTIDATTMMARPTSVDPTMRATDATTAMERTERVVVPLTRPARRFGRRLAMTGAVAVIGLTGTTALAAAANDGALPRPVRIVAHGVGLPVDSVELADAKHALSKLRKADDAALPGAVASADEALAKLGDDDRRRLGQPAAQEVDDARGRVNNSAQGSNNSGSGSGSGGNAGQGSGSGGASDDAPTTVATKSGNSTPATTAESNSGKGGSDSTTVTTVKDSSGKGGDGSSTTTISSGSGGSGGGGSGSGANGGSSTTSQTTSPSGSGGGSGNGGSGGGSSGGGSGSSGSSGSSPPATLSSSPPTTTDSGKGSGGGSGKGGSTTTTRP